jgi:hypothetical protein
MQEPLIENHMASNLLEASEFRDLASMYLVRCVTFMCLPSNLDLQNFLVDSLPPEVCPHFHIDPKSFFN